MPRGKYCIDLSRGRCPCLKVPDVVVVVVLHAVEMHPRSVPFLGIRTEENPSLVFFCSPHLFEPASRTLHF